MSDVQVAKKRRSKGTGSVFKPDKNGSIWWIAYWSGGKRRYESSGSDKWTVASKLLNSRVGDVAKGLAPTPSIGRYTLSQALQAVVDDFKLNGRKSTADTQRRINLHLLTHFSANCRMTTITTARMREYRVKRHEEGAATATVNRELAVLRRAFKLAIIDAELMQAPHVPMAKENNARQGFFERDELESLLKHLPREFHPPIWFTYYTGWRFESEVLSLTAQQVDMPSGVLRLELGTTKNGEGRAAVMTDELRSVLEKQMASIQSLKKRGVICPYIFHHADGSPMRLHTIRKQWNLARKAAGYPKKIFHDFRRTAARNFERAAVPRSVAMAIIGHKTESMYRRYTIVDETMLREAATKLNTWHSQGSGRGAKRGQLAQFRGRKKLG